MDIWRKLSNYGGEVANTKARFMGDTALYASCIEVFKHDLAFQTLGTALEQQDYQLAFESAHALKGVSSNLGLTPLFSLLSQMVDYLRDEEFQLLAPCYSRLMGEVERFREMMTHQ